MTSVRARLTAACQDADSWPLPMSGHTRERWAALASLAQADLTLARLVEAHADAVAILAELDAPARPGQRLGVWAAEAPQGRLEARCEDGGWVLSGSKAWCSGATLLTCALVTAHAPDGRRLFAVDLGAPGVEPAPATWAWPGMLGTDTRDVRFDGVRAEPVGAPEAYLRRPGFWVGGIGVAACWFGGAVGVAQPLLARAGGAGGGSTPRDPHAAAHLGAVHSRLAACRALLASAAVQVDAPAGPGGGGAGSFAVLAQTVRAAVDLTVGEVVERVGRALGPAPMVSDPAHAARVADLLVYVRQSHAERDLAALADGLPADPGWVL